MNSLLQWPELGNEQQKPYVVDENNACDGFTTEQTSVLPYTSYHISSSQLYATSRLTRSLEHLVGFTMAKRVEDEEFDWCSFYALFRNVSTNTSQISLDDQACALHVL